MCEFSSKLIAWLDHELPDAEAGAMDQHLRACAECRKQADAFRGVSHAFALYARAVPLQAPRSARAWLLVPAAIAAAVFAVFLLPSRRPPYTQPDVQPSTTAVQPPPAIVPSKAPAAAAAVRRPRVPKRIQAQAVAWLPAEPTIQVVIPADQLFPPGALPEGVDLVANLSLAADVSPAGPASRR
jgi:anti-sigma factor RsiW